MYHFACLQIQLAGFIYGLRINSCWITCFPPLLPVLIPLGIAHVAKVTFYYILIWWLCLDSSFILYQILKKPFGNFLLSFSRSFIIFFSLCFLDMAFDSYYFSISSRSKILSLWRAEYPEFSILIGFYFLRHIYYRNFSSWESNIELCFFNYMLLSKFY